MAAALSGFQNLDDSDHRERPVARVASAGAAARTLPDQDAHGGQIARSNRAQREAHLASLGVDLVALKFAYTMSRRQDCEDKLAVLLVSITKLKARQRDRVARQAITEWAAEVCASCHGAGQIVFAGGKEGARPTKICGTCSGSGKRRYSDKERQDAMGEALASAMAEAHGLIGEAERLAIRGYAKMLERWA
jgi:hypothetical protein